jgi:hypothetical protein
MVIKLNGEVVERVSRNDLHNTFSAKHHKPHFVPSYKNLYINQLKTNKGLLIALGITLFLGLGVMVGADIRVKAQKAEINRLQSELERYAAIGDQMVTEYNQLLTADPYSNDPEKIIEAVFKQDAEVMKKVAFCESTMNPKARNKNSTARGLFQVMASVHDVNEKYLYNPVINTLIAKQLYDASGLNPWNSSRGCWETK